MTKRSTLTTAENAFVHNQRVARLATADEHGQPTLVPICYAFDGTYFYTPLDEKPKSVPGSQLRRVRNITVRPEIALLIDQYADDWSHLGYVLIHGQAKLINGDDERHQHALQLLRERYQQYIAMALEVSPVIVISPERVTSWGPAIT